MNMSKVWDIVKTVGAGVISSVVPSGGLIVAGINALLPDDKKLPESATGTQVQDAIGSLPPELQAQVLSLEFEVDLTKIREAHQTARTMLETEQNSPQSTRPKIALQSFYLVAFVTVTIVLGWFIAVVMGEKEVIKAIVDGYMWVGVLLIPFIGWINRYFGILKEEQANRLNAINGHPVNDSGGKIAKMLKLK